MRRVLVTGANGYVGRALAAHLLAGGWTVEGLVRSPAAPPVPGVTYRPGDLLGGGANLVAAPAPDAIVHAAARAHRPGEEGPEHLATYRADRDAALALGRAARDAGVSRFVFLSSIGVHGSFSAARTLDETAPITPQTPYATAKAEAESGLREVFAAVPERLVILRPTLVYGAGAPGNFGQLLRLVRTRLPLPLGGIANRRTLVALDNLVDLIRLCLEHPDAGGETFIAGDAHGVSTSDMIDLLAQGMGHRARLWRLPPPLLRGLARLAGRERTYRQLVESLEAISARAQSVLAWSPPLTPEAALRQAGRDFAAR